MQPALSTPSADLAVQQLVASADAVVVASVSGESQAAVPPTVTLVVERSFKGGLSPGDVVTAAWQRPEMLVQLPTPNGIAIFAAGLRGVWFLRGSPAAGWSLMPTTIGAYMPPQDFFFPAVHGRVQSTLLPAPGDSAADRVLLEVCAGALEAGDLHSLRYQAALSAPRTPASGRCWQALADSRASRQHLVGLAERLQAGDLAALQTAAREVNSLGPSDAAYLAWAIQTYQDADGSGVPTLGRIAQEAADGSPVQAAAAYALRKYATKAALPFLAGLLDSSSQEVRYQAMAGMASFCALGDMPLQDRLNSRGQPVWPKRGPYRTADTDRNFPTVERFQQNEQQYITFWKNWWAAHPELHPQP